MIFSSRTPFSLSSRDIVSIRQDFPHRLTPVMTLMIWPGDLAYYVESYLLKIPEEFRQTMIQNKWRNPVAGMDFAKESIEINGIQMF